MPGVRLSTTSPVSTAARRSMPVPTSGASVIISGTAWRCMFAPIRARLASLCSRNGISAVATETICSGETSMNSTSAGSARIGSPPLRHSTWPTSLPLGSISAFAWAMILCSSCVASRRSTSEVTFPFFTRRYGVWMNPNSFTVA